MLDVHIVLVIEAIAIIGVWELFKILIYRPLARCKLNTRLNASGLYYIFITTVLVLTAIVPLILIAHSYNK